MSAQEDVYKVTELKAPIQSWADKLELQDKNRKQISAINVTAIASILASFVMACSFLQAKDGQDLGFAWLNCMLSMSFAGMALGLCANNTRVTRELEYIRILENETSERIR